MRLLPFNSDLDILDPMIILISGGIRIRQAILIPVEKVKYRLVTDYFKMLLVLIFYLESKPYKNGSYANRLMRGT